MAMKPPYPFRTHLFVTTHTPQGTPLALRLNLRRVYIGLGVTSLFLLVCLFGTLLFFHELERNRKLEERVLELETQAMLGPIPLSANEGKTSPLQDSKASLTTSVSTSASPPLSKAGENANAPRELTALSPTAAASLASVKPRIEEFDVDCAEGECHIALAMLPATPGVALGQLLFVLETEIPGIGAGNPQTPLRERYFIFPGNTARDSLSPNELTELEKKRFRFSRGLQTSADFQIGKVLRPLAANVYVFAPDKSLLLHERKIIETVDSYDH